MNNTCVPCLRTLKSYWGNGLYGPCLVCTWPKVLKCSCEQKGCLKCTNGNPVSELYYDEDFGPGPAALRG